MADTTRSEGTTRAAPVAGGFKKILSFVRVNGKDMMPAVESGDSIQLDGANTAVFFPNSKHAHDPISGPVLIARTPVFEVRQWLIFAFMSATATPRFVLIQLPAAWPRPLPLLGS